MNYQNPFAAMQQQLRQQLQDLDVQAQQYERSFAPQGQPAAVPDLREQIRREIDLYEQERQQAQPNPANLITAAIEEVLSPADLQLLAGNIALVPDYLRTKQGSDTLQRVIGGVKKLVESNAENKTE